MILAVPAREANRGGGHLVRCTKLVNELQAIGKEAILYGTSYEPNINEWNIELVVLDRFQTSKEELLRWKKLAPCVIGIDEGGKCRDEFDFLIDILPNMEKIKPNISDIGLLPLPQIPFTENTETRGSRRKILISFGLEDSAGLGNKVFNALKNKKDIELTYLNKENQISNLAEHLCEYDLIITHFGITAFEAVYAGTPVLLINPTPYHEKLSKKAGFISTRLSKISSSLSAAPLHRLYDRRSQKCCVSINKKSLAKLIASFSPLINRRCPVCEEPAPTRALARFPERTYRKCAKCGIIFMDKITSAPAAYGKEYFFEEYKKQYGKTYMEDFPNLRKTAKKRLDVIRKLIKIGRVTRHDNKQQSPIPILDIGCAYGAFLSKAKEEGFESYGIEACKEAVGYVTETLGISAIQGYFPAHSIQNSGPFGIITLWYTIEHFQNCVPVFKEIRSLLSPPGILAFSTPSFAGISGRKNLYRFLKKSPGDHFTIWSPKVCKKALKAHGFKIIKTVNCGHHPERFPFLGKLADSKKSPLYRLLLAISRLFSLGDTFEAYAVKLDQS